MCDSYIYELHICICLYVLQSEPIYKNTTGTQPRLMNHFANKSPKRLSSAPRPRRFSFGRYNSPERHSLNKQFQTYPHLSYAETVVNGYIRNIMVHSSMFHLFDAKVAGLCLQYFFIKEHGYNELMSYIANESRFNPLEHKSVSAKYLKQSIANGTKLNENDKKIECYLKYLVNRRFVIPKITSVGFYEFGDMSQFNVLIETEWLSK